MTHIIKSVEELEKLISDRIYVTNLTVEIYDHMFHLNVGQRLEDLSLSDDKHIIDLLYMLPDLEDLFFDSDSKYSYPIDLSKFSNLKTLQFGFHYNQPTDLSKCSNLVYLCFGDHYNQITDFSNLTNLEHLYFGERCTYNQNKFYSRYNKPTDLSKCTKLKYLRFGIAFRNEVLDITNLANLEYLYFGRIDGCRNESNISNDIDLLDKIFIPTDDYHGIAFKKILQL